MQPPSGGCVLKLMREAHDLHVESAATFGWLCVETVNIVSRALVEMGAATFGWLCVETLCQRRYRRLLLAATFGWLCVET